MIEMGVLIRAAEHKFAMSYKGFGQLRRDLAGLIGAEAAMNGTAGWPDVEQPSPELDQEVLALVFLLNHPDCEGCLPPEQCERLTPALARVIVHWSGDADKRAWVGPLADLRECCRYAADNHTALEFN
ncbi:hypothetical protein Isolate57596_50490 (plasmid) [Mycobacteroides abscessus subsp. abscessus]